MAVSFAFAGLLGELAVRLIAPQQLILIRPDLWQPADTVGWLHRPGASIEINTGERPVSVHTDAEGFRVGAGGPVSAEREVLLLGDSFIEALQVEYEQSSSGLLEARLPELLGSSVAVRNAGIGGWDPDQYLLRARTLLAEREYDLVITAVYLGNDVIPRRRDYLSPRIPVERHRLRLPRRVAWSEVTDAFLRPINDFLEVRSHVYLFFKNRMQTLRMELGLAPLSFPPQFLTAERSASRWTVTAELCEDIHDLAVQSGADALFVLVPTSFQVDSLAFMRYVRGYDLDPGAIDLEQPNRLLGDELTSRGLEVYDALPEFRAAYESGMTLYGQVDQHFSPEGNLLFAQLLAPLAAEVLLARMDDPAR